ncbi:histidine kinase dimerization/phosphoacceptor domain -containing protein [Methanobacterium sp.]|uniref:histidine kinase dimerization/phosphoacceptor domain -containing protein n=1 Tax=Methanobacterium sp. TaxID=2164 RepID=UPI003C72A40C
MVQSFLNNIDGWKFALNSFPDLLMILDNHFRVIWVNDAMEKSLNTPREKLIGSICFKEVHGIDCPINNCPQVRMLQEGTEQSEEIYEPKLGGYFLVTASPIKDNSGKILGSVHVARDITKRKEMEDQIKKSLEEREMLIKETHHRVKNNLMVISSLLRLQSRYIKDKETKDIFTESQNRARSMAIIHEKLYQTEDLKKIDFGDYIQKLSLELFRTYSDKSRSIALNFEIENHTLDIDTAIPLGLIVNELISNSLKHAFPTVYGSESINEKFSSVEDKDIKDKQINVKFVKNNGEYIFEVKDNGIGLPDDFNVEESASLGLRLVNSLVDQIHAQMIFDRINGTRFTIKFKDKGI